MKVALLACFSALFLAGSALAFIGKSHGGSCGKPNKPPCPTTSTPSTTTAPTTTTAPVTTTEPPPTTTAPPPTTTAPPSSDCTKTAAAGADLSTFLGTLSSGDVGCLHGGSYTDGASVTIPSGRALTEYPGETAVISGTAVFLSGAATLSELTIQNTAENMSCVDLNGSGGKVIHNVLLHCARHGIITHTDVSNALITRNFNDGSGFNETSLACCNHVHGIYEQGVGDVITRNVFANMQEGYGIHLYAHPSNTIVSQNTTVGSVTRNGILVDTDGSNVVVVNNILWANASSGVNNRTCGSGCVVGNNLTTDPQFIDALYHVAATSPAIDTGRVDYTFYPDRDGFPANGLPDLGAYEWH